MKKLFVAAMISVLVLAGCGNNLDDGNGNNDESDTVSFESFSPRSVLVENRTGERLVAFKDYLSPNTLIGGIPAYTANHGLEKKDSLFSQTGSFVLVLITEAEYNKNIMNIASAIVFSQIFVFYNNEAENNNVYLISQWIGDEGRIILNNPTHWNIEIRKDAPTGEILGFVAAQMQNEVLRLKPGNYDLFPVLKRYDSYNKMVYEVVPIYTTGNASIIGKAYSRYFVLSENNPQTWNLGELVSAIDITTGSFNLMIQNNSNTDIRFEKQGVELISSTGLRGIQQGSIGTYNIKVIRNPDGTYPETQLVSGYSVGTPLLMFPIPEYLFKTDYIYTIGVSGNNAATLVIGEIQEVRRMNIDDWFN
jgi:hypothetical protein